MKKVILTVILILVFQSCAYASDLPTAADIVAMLDRSAYEVNPDAIYWEAFNRAEPAPVGTPLWWKTSSSNPEAYVELCVQKIIRGEDAKKLIIERNSYNKDKLKDDQEFVFVQLQVKMQSADMSRKYTFDSLDFDFISKQGLIYKNIYIADVEDEIGMFSGATGMFELCTVIDFGDDPLLLYDDNMWFSLNPNYIPAPTPTVTP